MEKHYQKGPVKDPKDIEKIMERIARNLYKSPKFQEEVKEVCRKYSTMSVERMFRSFTI